MTGSTPLSRTGLLAIWHDCLPGRETAYEQWYQGEHLAERVGVPGFHLGRRYQAIGDAQRRYFSTYEVTDPAVLTGPDYRARLDDPTPATTAIMRDGFVHARRALCERHWVQGAIRGAIVVTVAFDEPEPVKRLTELTGSHPLNIELPHAEIWLASAASPATAEASLRGPDDALSGAVAFELLHEDQAVRLRDELTAACPTAEVGAYRLLCTLDERDLA